MTPNRGFGPGRQRTSSASCDISLGPDTQTACPNQAGPYLPHPEHFNDADGVRRHWGRGGTTARTIMQQHYVVTFLEDIYTGVERILIDADEREQVHQTRLAFQRAMEGRSAPRSKRRREGR
jgi:Na+-translocating membrane potential-generating system (MpsC)